MRSLAIYRDLMGFEIQSHLPMADPLFDILRRDGVGIMLKHISDEVGLLSNPRRLEWARSDGYVLFFGMPR